MRKTILGLCAFAIAGLTMSSNSFDDNVFQAGTVDSLAMASIDSEFSIDGRNYTSISFSSSTSNPGGTTSGSGTVTVTGGVDLDPIPVTYTSNSNSSSTTTSSSTTSSTTTGGGYDICDHVTGSFLRAALGCD